MGFSLLSCQVFSQEEEAYGQLVKAVEFYRGKLYQDYNLDYPGKVIAIDSTGEHKIYNSFDEAWDNIPLIFINPDLIYVVQIGDEYFLKEHFLSPD